MSQRLLFAFLGLITLLVFPLIGFLLHYFIEDVGFNDYFNQSSFNLKRIILGFVVGVCYALFIQFIAAKSVQTNELDAQKKMIKGLKLSIVEKLALSFCAGFGEEYLFRAGLQHWGGNIITSIVFVAIHGYLNPKKWKLALFGLILLPFIILLGWTYTFIGIWFCIAAHTSYDFVLFLMIDQEEEESLFFKTK